MIGNILGGNYRIDELAGTDGPFELFLVGDLRSEALFTARVLTATPTNSDLAREFVGGARALQRLTDDRIPGVVDVGEESGRYYAILERVDGTSLDRILRERGRMQVADAVGLVYQALHAVEVAHAAGIVHRGITPQRLVVDTSGLLKVTGFEAVVGGGPREGQAESTASLSPYAAPEEADEGLVDGRSDLFSIGVVLYELLTSRLPFADSEGSTASQEFAPPTRLRLLRPDVPRELEILMERVLDQDPARRPVNADEMRKALEAAMQGKPYELATAVALPPPPPQESKPALKPRRSLRPLVLGSVLAVLVLAVGIAITLTITGVIPLAVAQQPPTAAPTLVPTAVPTAVPPTAIAAKTATPTRVPATPSPLATPVATLRPEVLLVRQVTEKDPLGGTWQVKEWSDGTLTREEVVPAPVLPSVGAKINGLRFYESGPEGLTIDKRVYATRFAKGSTRYMNYELDLGYPLPRSLVDFTIRAFYFSPDGKQLVEQVQTAHIEASWTQSFHWNGYGWPTSGNWGSGSYRVDIYDGSAKITSATFEIY